MKPRLNSLLFSFLLAVSLVGCQTSTAAKTLLTCGELVNSAMNVYGELYRANALTPEQISTVRTKHAQFQIVYNAAAQHVDQDLSKLAPADVAKLALDLVDVMVKLKSAHPEVQTSNLPSS